MNANPPPPVASPCRRICRFSEDSGACLGCLRTRDEIRGWFRMSEEQKRSIVDDIPHRLEERRARRRLARAAGETTAPIVGQGGAPNA